MHINKLSLSDFRCFRQKQTVHLAPLTLLVGENSTGKTSLLALIHVLWDVAFHDRFPDFKKPPYDLGSFDEIAHHRGGRGGRATEFGAELSWEHDGGTRRRGERPISAARNHAFRFRAAFRRDGAAPFPSVRRIESNSAWVEACIPGDGVDVSLRFSTRNGKWELKRPDLRGGSWGLSSALSDIQQRRLPALGFLVRYFLGRTVSESAEPDLSSGTRVSPTKEDIEELFGLEPPIEGRTTQPFSSAPVRSRPRRTYDPSHPLEDAEGEHIPMFLSRTARRNDPTWESLKSSLEAFGQEAGLFDEIAIKTLGGQVGGPFQIQIRKFGTRAKGPSRNIIDVGYGVSQVLPIVTELLRPQGPEIFLLQQPEVHLHPSAQAALGSLFGDVAAQGRQLLVETHSDHLMDRIRMDVRDGRSKLKPEDVSILYFERGNLSVTIHSLGWDANGNLVARDGDIPDGYREFFRLETRRSLGL